MRRLSILSPGRCRGSFGSLTSLIYVFCLKRATVAGRFRNFGATFSFQTFIPWPTSDVADITCCRCSSSSFVELLHCSHAGTDRYSGGRMIKRPRGGMCSFVVALFFPQSTQTSDCRTIFPNWLFKIRSRSLQCNVRHRSKVHE